jgi:flagellar biosynthetic protein FliR
MQTVGMPVGDDWLITTLLLATRLAGMLSMTPPLGSASIPASVRVTFVLALAAALAAGASTHAVAASIGTGAWVVAVLSEFALGATMSLGISLGFAAFTQAARLIDVQIGFGMGQIFDPLTRRQLPVLSGAFNQLALVLFFASDAHLSMLRGLALSIDKFPPGGTWPLDQAAEPLIRQVAALFALGLAIVAPVVLCLILVELGLGVLSRNLPQLNTFVLGIPVKVIAGLAALSVWVAGGTSVMARIHAATFSSWEALFR